MRSSEDLKSPSSLSPSLARFLIVAIRVEVAEVHENREREQDRLPLWVGDLSEGHMVVVHVGCEKPCTATRDTFLNFCNLAVVRHVLHVKHDLRTRAARQGAPDARLATATTSVDQQDVVVTRITDVELEAATRAWVPEAPDLLVRRLVYHVSHRPVDAAARQLAGSPHRQEELVRLPRGRVEHIDLPRGAVVTTTLLKLPFAATRPLDCIV
mmetsp:Transcript_67251/g.219015  ORF Transcript_67251/g.219015 Transcript_67251/m.219015 type:complete len:212 (+) Transcript_67251:246-881(+)